MIKLSNVTKYYSSDKNIVLALRKINLEFKKGEFVAITGESGSGKSTLLNVMSGMDTYDEGELYFEDHPTSHYDSEDWEKYRKENIGFIFQSYNLIDSYTVIQNVETVLLIQGFDKEQAKKEALDIIDKVGLTKWLTNKASQLSSGQKQRLSIARALAKKTDVIMADEPTGNLDVETGQEIIKLLYQISKDKLVIVVTHNYGEIENYATRKIHLYDGEIQSDVSLKPVRNQEKDESKEINSENKVHNKKSQRISKTFALLNFKSQPKKTLLLLIFFIISTFSTYIFLGGFISNLDDTAAKSYDSNAFVNNDSRRICVRRSDGGFITDKDCKKIKTIKYVDGIEKYDLANDMSYAYRKNVDYIVSRNTKEFDDEISGPTTLDTFIEFKKTDNYMMSIDTLSNIDLYKGRLPKKFNEVVICSKDKSLLGKKILMYFMTPGDKKDSRYIAKKMKVVGLINSDSGQVYFTEEFEGMISSTVYEGGRDLCIERSTNTYTQPCYFVPNEDLKDNEAILSYKTIYTANYSNDENASIKIEYNILKKDKEIKKDIFPMKVLDKNTESALHVIDISEELFNKIYTMKVDQSSIYIKDYAYVDKVMNELSKMGYESISPLKIGSISYEKQMVRQRLINLCIDLIAIIATLLLSVIIIKALLKYKKNDYVILKLIGMQNKTVKHINYIELTIYYVCGMIVSLAAIVILQLLNVGFIVNIVKYYNFISFIIYILLNLITLCILAISYNRYLNKNFNITSLNNN